ncbi:THUMP domain protein [Methanocaldococcus vulcanius M7]|uniref:THUMP domain protein n=1 Tax=Methanocaldococcus vulcanius (strain ATCC 700851 / DSM 12094 / M7) TaxID=579137 RepID=C9RGG6_METVM|nr:THUMP domain-containing protein [Methanocaldococcus vulcanius]ACX72668.1 THUMP domain protein [Methanocaldococcus vulcanius M7]
MRPVALITTKPGFEPELKKEIESLKIKKKVVWTPFRGLLKVLSYDPNKFLREVEYNKEELKFLFRVIPLEKECETNIESIKRAVFSLIEKKKDKIIGKSFVVRCNRRGSHSFKSEDIEREIGKYILDKFNNLNLKVNLKNWDFKVNIEILQDESYVSVFTESFKDISIHKNIQNLEKLKKYEARPLNRSERKMQELIEKFPELFIDLNCVVDIGASPGGWAKLLSKLAKKVYAIDTGELKVKNDNIIHIKKRAESVNFKEDINEDIDLITNDTNLYPIESILLTLRFVNYLKSGGYIIHTVKAEDYSKKKSSLSEILEILNRRSDIHIYKIINLKANTKNELTLILKKV